MKTFWTKKNIAIVLAVLLVAVVVVLCIALRQKSVEDTEPTLTLTCQSADADGACTVDVVLSERANETGSARALCLPEAGSTLATSTGSVLVRLRFQLADGVTEAALTVSDAVLAAADETESLATTTAALTVVNATVQRG